ncbi:MAG: GNAT family N-acetyltransferase [Aquincola sp.]|nr:GNAT family N-acetyltransferase [Aquincola sp.]
MTGLREVEGDDADADLLEAALLDTLRATLPQGRNSRLTVILQDGEEILGGLVGSTAYGWLLVKVLWIDPRFRGRGLGRRLMARAADEAVARDCHGIWLDTSSPKARDFYLALGFTPFGQIANSKDHHPPEHRRWFLQTTTTDLKQRLSESRAP